MSHPLLRPLEELLEAVANEIVEEIRYDPNPWTELIADVLRAKLLPLLEAGQAMRHATHASSMIEAHHKWDAGLAALAKVKGKSA